MASEAVNILLVEDEEGHAEAVRRAFQKTGAWVNLTWASSLSEASAHLKESIPDLVIADWLLPDGKGTDILPADKDLRLFPVVLMTSHGSEQLAVETMKAGVVDYVAKSPDTFAEMPRIARRAVREWRLVREKRSLEQAFIESEQRFRSLAENSLTGIFVHSSLDDKYIYVNPRFAEIHGYSVDEMIGASPWQHIHPEDLEAVKWTASRRLRGEDVPHENEFRILAKNGQVRWVRAFVNYTEHGGHPARTGNIIDITDQRMAEQELNESLHKLKSLNDDLQQFVYVSSHDLKEPLRTIINCVQLLEKKCKADLGKDADRLIDFLVESSTRMINLIDDLLAYSRVGTRAKPLQPVDSETVLKSTITRLRTTVEENKALITHDLLPTVMADPTQLGLLFQNLILNGIKFHRDGVPSIHVSSRKQGDNWLFSVQDNGIGIKPEYFERIFVLFQRLHQRSEYPGTGIGLAIAKKIVARHGGSIWAESEPGVGSTFYFTIPDKN